MVNVKKLSNIEAKPVIRNRTWFYDLDLVYGRSDCPEHNLGMPKGKISLWSGESGVGKSRLSIAVAKNFTSMYLDGIVLYFQIEAPLEDFAQWSKDKSWLNENRDKMFCSGASNIDEIVKIIYQVRPKLIIIDSVNKIRDFTGNSKSTDRLIDGEDGKVGLKKVTHDVGAHLILLGQLNQDGKTIKGGTSLPHSVDIALNVVLEDPMKGTFKVEVGTKHRYGRRDNIALFKHTDNGVEAYDPCTSDISNISQKIYLDSDGNFSELTPEIERQIDIHAKMLGDVSGSRRKHSGSDWYSTIGNFLDSIVNR